MKSSNRVPNFWRNLSITYKFGLTVGLLLSMVALVALVSYLAPGRGRYSGQRGNPPSGL